MMYKQLSHHKRLQFQQAKPSQFLAKKENPFKRVVTQKCGILGIFTVEGCVSAELYEGLLMLQHRGQDSAGMVTTCWDRFHEYKGNGLVKDVFPTTSIMDALEGTSGIGHVRYPTAGSASSLEAQPFFVNSPLGIYLIHNGNLTNTPELRNMLESSESFFNRHLKTTSDSEVLLNVFADEIHRVHHDFVKNQSGDPNQHKLEFILEATKNTMAILKGAYSCISLIMGVGLVAFRDPNGIRPLVLGRRIRPGQAEEWCVASEDCAFGPIGFQRVRDVRPGEIVVISPDGQLHSQQCLPGRLNPCIFEYIYLSRPDSVLNDIPVYEFQLGLGTKLAEKIKLKNWDIDVIVPVPDGSRPAAIQVSAEMHLPYREGLVKNRYVGRTFIMANQSLRETAVRRKLNAMPVVFEGKSVLLIDDSIVRGTTMSQIVEMIRQAGAKKVYLASASPPVKFPNFYGVDLPSRKEFVAHNRTEQQVCDVLGADGLLYQRIEDLLDVGYSMNPSIERYDDSCFTGQYVTGDIDEEYFRMVEKQGRGKNRVSGQKTQLIAQPVVGGVEPTNGVIEVVASSDSAVVSS